jgi:starvation-inducible DNA-binding protein
LADYAPRLRRIFVGAVENQFPRVSPLARRTITKELHLPATSKALLQKGRAEPTANLGREAVEEISKELRRLLADVCSLYLKTNNFHWHTTGPGFRDYHLHLDEQADQIFGMTDAIAERARKIGGRTLRSIGEISREQRLRDSDRDSLSADEMLSELRIDNRELIRFLRLIHRLCERYNEVASASLIEVWIDETERRTWFLAEILDNGRKGLDDFGSSER